MRHRKLPILFVEEDLEWEWRIFSDMMIISDKHSHSQLNHFKKASKE
jgi:hypothetical protein